MPVPKTCTPEQTARQVYTRLHMLGKYTRPRRPASSNQAPWSNDAFMSLDPLVIARVDEEERLRNRARSIVFKIVCHFDMRSKEKITQEQWEYVGDLIRHVIPWDDYVYRRLVNIHHDDHYRTLASLYNLIRLQMDDWQKVAKANENTPGAVARLQAKNAWDDPSLNPDSEHYCIWVLTHHDIAMAEVTHPTLISSFNGTNRCDFLVCQHKLARWLFLAGKGEFR